MYTIKFNGKKQGAIGLSEYIVVQVEAESKKQALDKLYGHYDHIHNPVVVEE